MNQRLKSRIQLYFGSPGSRPDVNHRAPICAHRNLSTEKTLNAKNVTQEETRTLSSRSDQTSIDHGELGCRNGEVWTAFNYTGLRKGVSDKTLDHIVNFAGSRFVFFFMWATLVAWTVVGIIYKAPDNWQVVMQDGQSLQSYFWDTLLMRQQLNSSYKHVWICSNLRSRLSTFKKFLAMENNKGSVTTVYGEPSSEISGALPAESWYDTICSRASEVIGSLSNMILFWLGILAWVGCGAVPISTDRDPPFTGRYSGSNPEYVRFSDKWQLYVNTGTAVAILICTVFLQNIRARHDGFIEKFILDILIMDQKIERHLRTYFCDFETENSNVCIPSPKTNRGAKLIDWYSDVIGTGIGLFIAFAVIAAWLAIGKTMSWNDNWWLIIGTYTGLVGFLDGFVLRHVYFRVVCHEEENYATVAKEDLELFQSLAIEIPAECVADIDSTAPSNSKQYKISAWINIVCSSEWSVLAAIFLIVILIVIASILRWSETGQLLCNTPTMIIEAFFLIVLIQAHNWADKKRRLQVSALYARRTTLLSYVERSYPLY
ncbi:LAMI_0C11122g1_1 [Lachancea mirantina]|uniref:LAMI_0C11122g1_1 n=1 Tax=Lachancea mirantina TaxID=1230905 RepID=A0A1G4J6C9_9SACH|nr:LAMI_0C11122g1_1 [Lachancea mirantina]